MLSEDAATERRRKKQEFRTLAARVRSAGRAGGREGEEEEAGSDEEFVPGRLSRRILDTAREQQEEVAEEGVGRGKSLAASGKTGGARVAFTLREKTARRRAGKHDDDDDSDAPDGLDDDDDDDFEFGGDEGERAWRGQHEVAV